MGVMMDVFCKSLGPEYIFNWDATQYEVNPKGNLRVLVVDDDTEDSPVTVESEGGLSYFIKHFHLHNADGTIAPPVYILAYDSMDAESLIVKKVPGMGYNNDIAWICFTKTRAGNTAFFTWYIREVILPFVTAIRNLCEAAIPVSRFKRPFLYCDGENKQISVIQTPDVLNLLSEAGVDVAKTPASCSGILQASDVSNAFKAIKTRLKNLNDESGLGETQLLVLRSTLATMPGFTAPKKKSIIAAFQKVVFAVKNSVKPETIQAGFSRTGQYPVDFQRTLSVSTYRYSTRDLKQIRAAFPRLRQCMAEKSQISEEIMDSLGIINVANKAKN